jgi:hypothetical protein
LFRLESNIKLGRRHPHGKLISVIPISFSGSRNHILSQLLPQPARFGQETPQIRVRVRFAAKRQRQDPAHGTSQAARGSLSYGQRDEMRYNVESVKRPLIGVWNNGRARKM